VNGAGQTPAYIANGFWDGTQVLTNRPMLRLVFITLTQTRLFSKFNIKKFDRSTRAFIWPNPSINYTGG